MYLPLIAASAGGSSLATNQVICCFRPLPHEDDASLLLGGNGFYNPHGPRVSEHPDPQALGSSIYYYIQYQIIRGVRMMTELHIPQK